MTEETHPPNVFVDAKILNMHDKSLGTEAYVGYLVKETGARKAKEVDAGESDDAEILAVIFAIEDLKSTFPRMTIVCDHQSVVSEAKKGSVRKPSPHLARLRELLSDNPGVALEALQSNLAHGVVTDYVNRVKEARESHGDT